MVMVGSSSRAESKKALNPLAKEWDPLKERAPEERRSIYLAFSSWQPLDEDEITLFFHQMFGRCVENVNVQRQQQENRDAMLFGRVVFQFSAVPMSILGKEDQVLYIVNSKSLWCLRFDPTN